MTPLHVAAERAHNDIMEVLQKHGAKVNPPAVHRVVGLTRSSSGSHQSAAHTLRAV